MLYKLLNLWQVNTKLLYSKDKTVNKQVMESNHYQGKKRKIVVFALTVKKQKLVVEYAKDLC